MCDVTSKPVNPRALKWTIIVRGRLGERMDKHTKFCELKVFLKNGQKATGLFHVPMRTSSAIRPSDALQEKKNDLLLLSDVTLYENNIPRQIPAILMPYDSVAYIELPAGWSTKEEPEAEAPPSILSTPLPTAAPLPKAASPLPLRASPPPPAAPTPKWMAQRTPPK